MQTMKSNRLKIGLALGSGGAKGLAHIGIIKVLAENDIPIDFIAGTSIGALVGAHFAVYQSVELLEKAAFDVTWRNGVLLFDPTLRSGFIKGEKVESFIKKILNGFEFSDLKIPLTVMATDMESGESLALASGDIVKAVRASVSVPPIFKPVKYKNRILADGGLSNPVPADIVRKMGADIVIAVNLDNDYSGNITGRRSFSLPAVATGALNIMRHHLAQNCLKSANIIVEPRVDESGLVGWHKFFNNEKTAQVIKTGELAMRAKLKDLKELLAD